MEDFNTQLEASNNGDDKILVSDIIGELYKELQGRMIELENRKQTKITLGRIAELQLVIFRVQQILLDSLNVT